MDQTAQNTSQVPQQQARPVTEPLVRDPLAQPQPPVPQQQPSAPKTISVGTEMGRFQVANDEEEEDDKGSSRQYTPLQSQTPSEIIHQPSTEKMMTQAAPPSESNQTSAEKLMIQSVPQSEIITQPSAESVATQAMPQEVAQQSSEMIRPAVPEVEVPKEVGHLVQKAPLTNNPFLPPELQNAGVRHTIPQVVVPQNPYGIKELPLPYEEAVAKEKAFRPKDAAKWIAAKVHYYWKKINPSVYK